MNDARVVYTCTRSARHTNVMKRRSHHKITVTKTPWDLAQSEADRSERAKVKSMLAIKLRMKRKNRIEQDPELQKRIDAFQTRHGIKRTWENKDPKMRVIRRHPGYAHKKISLPKFKLPE